MLLASFPDHASQWYRSAEARELLADLGPADVRLVLARGVPGSDRLAWHPDSTHGMATFEFLADIRQGAIGPEFAMATTVSARASALATAQRAPSIQGAIAVRFGDPDRWLAFGAREATRRFRANWA